tara:strand:+ start:16407 stop:17852 length:1446 start_codon:yes stop_codon:yes gene_type:complete
MRALRLTLLPLFSFALIACGNAAESDTLPTVAGLIEGSTVSATVTDLGEGAFQVEYVFATPQSAMIFSRSMGNYRLGAWTPLEPGSRIDRIAGFDALLFDTPVDHASFRVEARFARPDGDYAPFVAFSDGGIVVFTGQFELLPEASRDTIEALGGQIDRWSGEQPVLGVRVRSSRPIIADGESGLHATGELIQGGGRFVYIGDASLVEGDSFIGVVDPGLPAWLSASFDADLAAIFARYKAMWGFELDQPASLLFAFGGYEAPGFSNKGGVLGSSLMLDARGEGLREETPQLRHHLQWFFAHEAAHLFQNAGGVGTASASDSWIHEGAANAMANAALAELTADPHAELVNVYGLAIADCTDGLSGGSLESAAERGRFQAYYDCGSLIALMTTALIPDQSLYQFWSGMQAAAREQGRELDTGFYLQAMEQSGADPSAVAAIDALISYGLTDPAQALNHALDQAGLNPVYDEEGRLTDMDFPA